MIIQLLIEITKNHRFCKLQSTIIIKTSYLCFMIRLTAFWAKYTDGMLKLEDHDRIAWVPVENLLRYDMTEADHPIRDALVRLFFES